MTGGKQEQESSFWGWVIVVITLTISIWAFSPRGTGVDGFPASPAVGTVVTIEPAVFVKRQKEMPKAPVVVHRAAITEVHERSSDSEPENLLRDEEDMSPLSDYEQMMIDRGWALSNGFSVK